MCLFSITHGVYFTVLPCVCSSPLGHIYRTCVCLPAFWMSLPPLSSHVIITLVSLHLSVSPVCGYCTYSLLLVSISPGIFHLFHPTLLYLHALSLCRRSLHLSSWTPAAVRTVIHTHSQSLFTHGTQFPLFFFFLHLIIFLLNFSTIFNLLWLEAFFFFSVYFRWDWKTRWYLVTEVYWSRDLCKIVHA